MKYTTLLKVFQIKVRNEAKFKIITDDIKTAKRSELNTKLKPTTHIRFKHYLSQKKILAVI